MGAPIKTFECGDISGKIWAEAKLEGGKTVNAYSIKISKVYWYDDEES